MEPISIDHRTNKRTKAVTEIRQPRNDQFPSTKSMGRDQQESIGGFSQKQPQAQPSGKKEWEPITSSERYRDDKLPSGLKNIGNSKYFYI